ncbi:MAG: beta-lactamase family protein, partial [Acidobacteriota bacterium]|nr:beta-lactamase family protein [Acidobacteriota bacterium]
GSDDVALADSHAGGTETVIRVHTWPRGVARHASVKWPMEFPVAKVRERLLERALAIIGLAISVCACGGAGPTTPVVPPTTTVDLKSSLSTSFDALSMPANAACSISISQHGQVVLERGRGQVAPGRPAAFDSLYRIASLTKPITASAVLISEQAGRLLRSDKVNRFLAYAEPAPTIDELIKHIPGLPNFQNTPAYQNGYASPTTLESLLSLIQPWDGIRRYQYSNSHYALLGAVLQQVHGLRYEEVVQRDIFGPAGMSQSSFAIPPASESVGIPFASTTHPSWVYAAGGVTSSAADLNRFNQALLSNRFGFGAAESFDRSAGVTSFGLGSGVVNGDLRFTHSGLLDTYSSYSVIFPADRSSVVVLCNFNSNALKNLVTGPNGIREIMLGR